MPYVFLNHFSVLFIDKAFLTEPRIHQLWKTLLSWRARDLPVFAFRVLEFHVCVPPYPAFLHECQEYELGPLMLARKALQ